MAFFTISTDIVSAQTLDFGEAGFVTPSGSLLVVGPVAVTMTDFAFLTVTGSVFCTDTAVRAEASGFITVGDTGVLTASVTAINITGVSIPSTVTNRGVIFASTAIQNTGNALNVVNSGTITGDGGRAIASTHELILSNSGDIFGRTVGISSSGIEATVIVNSGLISGGGDAMSLSDGVSTVTNTGILRGKALLGGGTDLFDGTGGTQGQVFGGNGNDTLLGGAGIDALFGGGQADQLDGGAARDRLAGGTGNDTMWGETGDDNLAGDSNADLLYGGDGDDVLAGGTEIDRLFGGAGDDSLSGGTGTFNDTLRGGFGDDTLTGGAGADTFVFLRNQGTDRITDFVNNVDKLDLRAFDFANIAAVTALASASTQGLRIDLPGEGVLFVGGLTLAQLNVTDVLL